MSYTTGWRIMAVIAFLSAAVVQMTTPVSGPGIHHATYLMTFACYCALQTISSQLGEKK